MPRITKADLELQLQKLKCEHEQLLQELINEREQLHKLKVEHEQLLQKSIDKQNIKNERNAGRKPVVDAVLKERILKLHNDGLSLRAISREVGVAVATVKKAVDNND